MHCFWCLSTRCKVPAPLLTSNPHTAGSRASLRLDSWRRSSRRISSMQCSSSPALVSRLRSESATDSSDQSGGPTIHIHRANTFHGRRTSLPLSSPQPTSLIRDPINSSGQDDDDKSQSHYSLGSQEHAIMHQSPLASGQADGQAVPAAKIDGSSTFTIGTKVRLHPISGSLLHCGTSEMLEGTVLAVNGDRTLTLELCDGESSWVEVRSSACAPWCTAP